MTLATSFRSGPLTLDQARRSLVVHGQELKLQPRVFDLLCYLVRHRERVVSKDELLDALWPGTVVVDNALQRVVSLARGALADAGLPDAVRTYARHGYRFVYGGEAPAHRAGEVLDEASASPPAELLVRARESVGQQDWASACAAYAAADAASDLAPADVEAWGRAAICAGLGLAAVAALERAVAQQDAAGNGLAAARATLLLVQVRTDHRQGALARGLLQRAARYLQDQGDTAERGHLAWMQSRCALGAGDLDAALAAADEACRVGRALRDADVECLGLVYRGHSLMARGDNETGLAQHEEAAAVIRLGGVQAWVAGWALCSIIYSARYREDWLRAAQFADTFVDWSRASRMPAFPGTCQLHRAAVLGMQGELERAVTEVRAAVALLAQAAPWAEGDAYCVLGDIQLGLGDFAAAEASFRQAHALGWDPQPGLARLHLATDRPAEALRGLERALQEADFTLRERRAQLLCLLTQAAALAGERDRARRALATLAAEPGLLATEALLAMHAEAEAELALADGDLAGATRLLRQATRRWRELGSPCGEAQARLRLAFALLQEGDADAAELEVHAVESQLARFAQARSARLVALKDALRAARTH